MEDVSAGIAELVAEGHVQGSRLAQAVRARYPEWSPQDADVRNLKEFVEKHVDGVEVVARAGMDVVYGLEGTAEPGSSPGGHTTSSGRESYSPRSVNLWRIWVSPNSPYAMAVDRTDGSISTTGRDETVGEGFFRLDPMDQARHRQVARDFLTELDGYDVSDLAAILDGAAEDWWQPWFRKLQSMGVDDRWRRARVGAFESLLDGSLAGQGLSAPVAERVKAAIVQDRFAQRTATQASTRSSAPVGLDQPPLAQIVVEAVQRMSVSDLRQLKLPVGIVLDVVQRDRS